MFHVDYDMITCINNPQKSYVHVNGLNPGPPVKKKRVRREYRRTRVGKKE